jgi:hypothetical protein
MADKTLFETLAETLRETLEEPPDYLPPLPAVVQNQVADALNALDTAASNIKAAQDMDGWASAANDYRNALSNVADTAFGGTPQAARDDFFARFLLTKMPRTASTMLALGIIESQTDTSVQPPVTHYVVDWQELEQFVRDPGTLVNEETWENLFADLGHPHSGRLPAILAGLLIMAPRTIIALIEGDLKIASLPPPPVRSDPNTDWAQFRQVSEDWISFTLPVGDPAKNVGDPLDPRVPANKYDLVADMHPNLSPGVYIRSKRHALAGGGIATDFELWVALGLDTDRWEWEPWKNWVLAVEPGAIVGFGKDGLQNQWHGAFSPFGIENQFLPTRPDDPVTISFDRVVPGGAPDILLGPPYDTRLVIQDLGLWIKFREAEPVFEVAARVKGLEAVLAPRWFRLFGQTDEMFREGLRFTFDFDISYGVGRGVSLNLQSGLEMLLVLNKTLGSEGLNIKLHSIRFVGELTATTDGVQGRLNVRFHISGQIGPVGLVIDGPGAWVGYWPPDDEISPYFGFLPPTGAGLSLELGPIMIGGFLDFSGGPNDRYAGILAAKLWSLEIIAFGVHETLPSGKNSLILVLGIRYQPGVQIGFGFAITGVGGIIGIHRRIDTDHLRERLTSGATGNILFAPDPVKSAPVILGDLDYIFPAAENIHTGGPTLQITWLGIARFDIGIVIEIATGTNQYNTTGLTKIVLLGTARAQIGDDVFNAVMIRLDLVGIIDFIKEVIEFDATLYDSRLMKVFLLVGDTAFRLSWGHEKYVMLTLGGFHPDFNPAPAVFPDMARLGLAYDTGSVGLWLRLEFYLAVTTNTVQLGGKIEVGIKASVLNAVGWLALDALIQFIPFEFSVMVSAGFRVRLGSMTLCGVRFSGTISGPIPLELAGSICIEILFFEICWSDSFKIGDGDAPPPTPTINSLRQALAPELSKPENLEAVDSDDRLVTAKPQQVQNGQTVLSTIGKIQWTEKRAPLNTLIERFENTPLASPQAVIVSSPVANGDKVKDWFSPGTFTNLSESERLNRASFERLEAGLVLSLGTDRTEPVAKNIVYDSFILPQLPLIGFLLTTGFPSLVIEGVYGRCASPAQFQRSEAAINIKDETWTVHTAGVAQTAGLSQTDAHQRARYQAATALPDNDVIDLGGI